MENSRRNSNSKKNNKTGNKSKNSNNFKNNKTKNSNSITNKARNNNSKNNNSNISKIKKNNNIKNNKTQNKSLNDTNKLQDSASQSSTTSRASFNWYPGHMTKAKRMMQENIKLIDLIIELVDARVPLSSRNPDIDELGKNKARLIILNKSDLAEERWNEAWTEYFKKKGFHVVKVNSRKGGGVKSVQSVIQEACKAKIERDRKRGILNRPVRAMVVGIPNVGKSTFINPLAGKAAAKTGNKPGVTKGKQWIRLNKQVELLDTPGILWPKFEDQTVGLRLALIGSIKDEVLQTEELAAELIRFLAANYPGVLENKYTITAAPDPYVMLGRIAESRHCLVRGNELDTEKAAMLLMDDFREGKLGRLTLEYPQTEEA